MEGKNCILFFEKKLKSYIIRYIHNIYIVYYIYLSLFYFVNIQFFISKGTIAISMTLITTAVSPYLFRFFPKAIKQSPVITRCAVLFFLNALFLALMGVLDLVLERYPDGQLAFAIISVLRSLQGLTTGLLVLILQVIYFNYVILCCHNTLQFMLVYERVYMLHY